MRRALWLLVMVGFGSALGLLVHDPAGAQDTDDGGPLRVVTAINPPWVVTEADQLTGAFVQIWEGAAQRAGLDADIEVLPSFADVLAAVRAGEADVALTPITPTADRAADMDFSTGVFVSGSQVVHAQDTGGRRGLLRSIFSSGVLRILIGGFVVLFVAANVFWYAERGQRSIDRRYAQGIFDSMWFALVTITTVGYGDTVPQTRWGRVATMVFIVSSLFVLGAFTAQVTSSLTEEVGDPRDTPGELVGQPVAAVADTTHAAFVERFGGRLVGVATTDDVYRAITDGRAVAGVTNPQSVALTLADRDDVRAGVEVHNSISETFGLRRDAAFAERLDTALLELRDEGVIDAVLARWIPQ